MKQKGPGMATPSDAASPPRRSVFRMALPFVIIGLAATVIIGVWALPLPDLDKLQRVLTTAITLMLGTLLLAFWLVFFSGWRLWQSIGLLLCAFCVAYGMVGRVTFNGDMVPTFHLRWEDNHAAILEEQRATQKHIEKSKEALAPTPGDYAEYRGAKRDGVITGPALCANGKPIRPKRFGGSPLAAAMQAL